MKKYLINSKFMNNGWIIKNIELFIDRNIKIKKKIINQMSIHCHLKEVVVFMIEEDMLPKYIKIIVLTKVLKSKCI